MANYPVVDLVMFQNISESTIANAILKTRRSNGPFGLDAEGWRRILVSKNFGAASHNLRHALAIFARKFSSTETKVFFKMIEDIITWKLINRLLPDSFRTRVLDQLVSVRYYEGLSGKPYFQTVSQNSYVTREIYKSASAKPVDLSLLNVPWVTSSMKSPLMHCSWWTQIQSLTLLTERSSSTTPCIFALWSPSTSGTVIVYYLSKIV